MVFIESLNEIKDAVTRAEKLIKDLPEDFKRTAQNDMDSIREIVVQLAVSLQKDKEDKELNEKLKAEIYRKMDASSLYGALSKEEKAEISEIVLESSDKELLDMDELVAFYAKMLRRLTPDDLVDYLYDKKDILDFGRQIVPKEMSDEIAYNAGRDVLLNNAKLPQKREEMVESSSRDLRKNKATQLTTLKNYYGI